MSVFLLSASHHQVLLLMISEAHHIGFWPFGQDFFQRLKASMGHYKLTSALI